MSEPTQALTGEVSAAALRWARERALLSHADVADKLARRTISAQTIEEWEDGKGGPTPAQFKALVKLFRVPAHWMFYAEPPRHFDDVGVVDFRTSAKKPLATLSQNLRGTIEHALAIQAWVSDYRAKSGDGSIALVGAKSDQDSPRDVAEFLRKELDVERLRSEAADAGDFFKKLRGQLESHGVLVMRMGQVANKTRWSLNPQEFRGFTLIDDDQLAPLIFINRKDLEEAQLFTLGHELGHLVTGGSGVSNEDILNFDEDRPAIERFCDLVAEELIVPSAKFERVWGTKRKRFDADRVNAVAAELKVTPVIAGRRAVTLGRGSAHTFQRFVEVRPLPPPKKKSSGGNPYNSYPSWYGDGLVRLLASAATSGHPGGSDALGLLGVQYSTAFRLAHPPKKAEKKSKKQTQRKQQGKQSPAPSLPKMGNFPLIEIDESWRSVG